MVASLQYYTGRTVRWPTAQRAFDIMRMACALTRGQTPANLGAGPDKGKGQSCGVAMTGPRTSYFRETTKDYQASKC